MSQANNAGKFVGDMLKANDQARADYRMSKQSRFLKRKTGLATGGGTGDYHIRNETDYYRDIEKARDMDRNDVMAGQMLDRLTVNIIQEGFAIDPKTGDKQLDADLKQRWNHEACDPEMMDIAGEMCFHDIEYNVARAMFRDGDCAVIGTDLGCYQFLESHVIQTQGTKADTVLGITIDEYRRKQSLWVSQDSTDPSNTRKAEEVEVKFRDEDGMRQVFHVYNPKRTTLTRGVTAFAPIFEQAGMLEDINFSKLVQQQIVSCFAIFRSQSVGGSLPSVDGGYGSQTTETTSTGETRLLEGIAPGMEIVGAAGETLEGFSPNVPNSEYFQQVDLIMKLMSTAFGVPLMVLLLDASQTNFSGWRGAIDEARKGFRYHQHNLIKRFHSPAYCWRVKQWAADDPALQRAIDDAGLNAYGHKWNPPAWNYIEPMKDATSDLLRLQNSLISPRRLHQERGRDYAEIVVETIDDNAAAIKLAIEKAKELTGETGVEIHYGQLLASPTKDGTNLAINVGMKGGE